MNEIAIFTNPGFGEIRTLETDDGKVLFCGTDVAKALGYSNPRKAIADHCRCVTKRDVPHPQSPDKTIEMSFIPEGDVYRLITHSKLPEAEKFEAWVFDEVLPTIRKHGVYMASDKARALEIKEMNARTRMSNQFLKLAAIDVSMSKDYKSILIAKAAQVLAGEEILPLPKSEQKMYTATEIGKMFGVSAKKIGTLANQHHMKIPEYGEFYKDKSPYSPKEVDAFRYNDRAVEQFKTLLPYSS